jgi:septal ring factor EnvC (AmiA/AmiB activator)
MNRWLLSIAAIAAVGCSTGPKGQVVKSIPSDSTEFFRTQVQEMTVVSAAKDSLFRDLAETTKLLADINTELTKVSTSRRAVEPVVSPESQLAVAPSDQALVLKKVQDLTARVRNSEARLAASQRRVRELGAESEGQKIAIADFQTTIDGLRAMVEGQKTTIATLEAELNESKAQVVTLTQQTVQLTDTVSAMTTRENTVYYVVGTKKELIQKGIIQEVGGTRFLIFTRTGETLKPAEELDPSEFTAIDRRQVAEIPMPRPDKEYRVVTNQNLAFANIAESAKGKVRGSLQIIDPQSFWTNSKFLILVEN